MNDLLAIDDLHTAYGLSRVLFGISLDIAAGECVCLLGRNGVGKTTTIRSVMGLVPPTSGRIVWKGNPPRHGPVPVIHGAGACAFSRPRNAHCEAWRPVIPCETIPHARSRQCARSRRLKPCKCLTCC